jgi:hypothetical protein
MALEIGLVTQQLKIQLQVILTLIDTSTIGHIKYSTGPVSVGYRMAEDQSGTTGANGVNTDAYAIAFAVNENLSISYASQDSEFDRPSTTNITERLMRLMLHTQWVQHHSEQHFLIHQTLLV